MIRKGELCDQSSLHWSNSTSIFFQNFEEIKTNHKFPDKNDLETSYLMFPTLQEFPR